MTQPATAKLEVVLLSQPTDRLLHLNHPDAGCSYHARPSGLVLHAFHILTTAFAVSSGPHVTRSFDQCIVPIASVAPLSGRAILSPAVQSRLLSWL